MAKSDEKFQDPVSIKVDKLPRYAGFAMQNVEKEQYFWAQTRGFAFSDSKGFFTYISIIQSYFNLGKISENYVSNFIILHHKDLSADIYVNKIPIAIEMLSKRSVEAGEGIVLNDIADIRRLRFPKINILPDDHIFICLKVGWRFVFFFDMTSSDDPDYRVDTEKLYSDLGNHYRQLVFYDVYEIVKSKPHYEQLLKEGWFPYVEILQDEYLKLSKAFEDNFNIEGTIENIVSSFNQERSEKITSRWWNNPIFKSKQKILQAGVNAYLTNTEDGYINSIKNLYTEIEGILRAFKHKEKQDRSGNTKVLAEHLQETAEKRMGSTDTALFPSDFTNFLTKYFYPQFVINDSQFELTRHTVSHGLADQESYTRLRALQVILILDQIYFYIPSVKK